MRLLLNKVTLPNFILGGNLNLMNTKVVLKLGLGILVLELYISRLSFKFLFLFIWFEILTLPASKLFLLQWKFFGLLKAKDGHFWLFYFVPSLFVNDPVRSFFQSLKKNFFSQNYHLFSIYFIHFLTERSFGKIISSLKKFVWRNSLFQKIIRSIKKIFFFKIF